jgi:DNA-binding NtrC family response regulator
MSDRSKHLLLVEDEPLLREAIAEQLAGRKYRVEQAGSAEVALARLDEFAFDVVITDLRLPGMDGTAVVEGAVALYPEIVAIVMTGFSTIKIAVEAIKRGAADFVAKPFQIEELLHALDGAFDKRRLKSENAYLRAQLDNRHRFEGIVGKSETMTRLFHLLETVAATSSTILITGETGSGKEVVARAIHHNSPRRSHSFVALNCSAIPETLLEAELFGHVRGAFTGAIGNRQGRVEQAHKGTLFLDEVGTMSPALQVKLLRVLQEREFERIGDVNTTKVDVRVIAATNGDLRRMVNEGQFREDLFYRLNVIPVAVPPLRDRREDIPLLVQHFLDKFRESAPSASRQLMTVSQEAMRRLMSFHWPGNVRQLENTVERAVAIGAGRTQIDVGDLLPELVHSDESRFSSTLSLPDEGLDLDAFVASVERELIQRSLERTGGNKGRAARLLNLKRTTLVEKLKRLEKRA